MNLPLKKYRIRLVLKEAYVLLEAAVPGVARDF
jgi:hypothetical protein